MNLYQIMVPCQWNDGTPVRTRHHKAWDDKVRRISGGLTVLKPAKGTWEHEGDVYAERVIPVMIACTATEMNRIVQMTIVHYEQLAVLYFLVSQEVHITHATPAMLAKFQRKNIVVQDKND